MLVLMLNCMHVFTVGRTLLLMLRYLAKHPEAAWEDVPNLPKAAVQLLNDRFAQLTSSVVQCQTSSGGDTTKLLLRLQNGMEVEAVIMHYDTTGATPTLLQLCASPSRSINCVISAFPEHA